MKEQLSALNAFREIKVHTPSSHALSPLSESKDQSKSKVVGSLLSAKSRDNIYNVSKQGKQQIHSQVSIPSIKKVLPITQNFLKAQSSNINEARDGQIMLQQSSYFRKISNNHLEKFQLPPNNNVISTNTNNVQSQGNEGQQQIGSENISDKKKVLISINTNRIRNPNSQSVKVLHTEKHPTQCLEPLLKKQINEPTLSNLKLRLNQNLQEKLNSQNPQSQEESTEANQQNTLRSSQSGNLRQKNALASIDAMLQNQQTKKYLQSIWKRTEISKQDNTEYGSANTNSNSIQNVQKIFSPHHDPSRQFTVSSFNNPSNNNDKINYKTGYGNIGSWSNQGHLAKSHSHQTLSSAQELRQKKIKLFNQGNENQNDQIGQQTNNEQQLNFSPALLSEELRKSQVTPLDLKDFKIEQSQKTQQQTAVRSHKQRNAQYLKYSALSKAGKNVRQQLKTNQDSYAMAKGFCGPPTNWFFGVFDGHGMNGHSVSEYVSKNLPVKIQQLVNQKILNFRQRKYISTSRPREKSPQVQPVEPLEQQSSQQNQPQIADINNFEELSIKDLMIQSYHWINEQLQYQGFDIQFSGTTSVTVVVSKEYFITSNVGDSKCILFKEPLNVVHGYGQLSGRGQRPWENEQLSRDHKPNLSGESERILGMKGRIESYKDTVGNNVGPMRVWLLDEDLPGLAMSRSIGDKVAESVGVIATPDVKIYKRNTDLDRAIVLCSDGVSEFLQNEQIGEIIQPFYEKNDTEGACRRLIDEATSAWQKEEIVIDDITAIVIFFH